MEGERRKLFEDFLDDQSNWPVDKDDTEGFAFKFFQAMEGVLKDALGKTD